MPTQDVIEAAGRPGTVASLTADFDRLSGLSGSVTIVHSSLSSLGWVAGGSQSVVEALLATIGPNGTLVMPTQSNHLSDPADWTSPPIPADWVDESRDALPAFDRDLTPTRSMGAIAECFRSHRATIRSAHPLMSLAANGPLARDIVEPHALSSSFGESSPLGRLYELGAQVLLLGVSHTSNTSLHLAEHRAEWPGKRRVEVGAPMLVDGVRQWVTATDLEFDESDFGAIGAAFGPSGMEHTATVACATARRFAMRDVVDFAVGWMSEHRPGSLDH